MGLATALSFASEGFRIVPGAGNHSQPKNEWTWNVEYGK